jgi:excisionase family DNA binding protein
MAILTNDEAIVADGLDTVEEARAFLRVSRSTIYSMMGSGTLRYVRLGRSRRIPHRCLIELAKGGLVGSEQASADRDENIGHR